MRKTMLPGLAAAAVLASGLVATGAAYASDTVGVPTQASTAVLGSWTWASFTDWQPTNTTPADPDGHAGEDNPANTLQIGEGYSTTYDAAYRQKVNDGWQRFTQWQTDSTAPAVGENEEAGHRYERTVGQPAWTETITVTDSKAVPAIWQNFSPDEDQGTFEGEPSWPTDPRGTWHHEEKELPPGQAGPDGVYQNGTGNGSWFYRHAAVAEDTHEETVEHPGDQHTEYQWDVYAFHYEYRWSVYQRTNTTVTTETPSDTPSVAPSEAPSDAPTTPTTPVEPADASQPTPTVLGTSASAAGPRHRAHPHRSIAAAVPTVIHAGL